MSTHPGLFSAHRARSRRPGTWALILTLWFLGRTAQAQDVASWSLASRVRPDDPDLVRAGFYAAPTSALAEGARVLHAAAVDVDDTHEALVMEVSPREDPSPMNVQSGTVLLLREARGWRAVVLAREEPMLSDDASVARGWRVVLDRGRRALVLSFELATGCENASGHGHHSFRQYRAIRVRLVGGEPRWFECLRQEDDEDGAVPWHVPDPNGGSARRPAPRWCRAPALTAWTPPEPR